MLLVGCTPDARRDVLQPFPDSVRTVMVSKLLAETADDPEDEEYWYLLSYHLAAQGDSAEAFVAIKTALALEVDSTYAGLAAFLYGWAGQPDSALIWANGYWQQQPANWDLRVAMAEWSAQTGQAREALLFVNEALEKLPNYGPYLYEKGRLFLRYLPDTAQAEPWLQQAMATEGGWGPATADLLSVYISTGRAQQAQEQLTKLRTAYPNQVPLWRLQARTYATQQQPDSVLWALHQVRQLDSGRWVTWQLAEHHRTQGSWDSAGYYAQALVAVDSTEIEGWRILARMADTRYRYADATRYYNQILGLDSTDQLARDELAIVARKVAYLRRRRAQQDTAQISGSGVPTPQP